MSDRIPKKSAQNTLSAVALMLGVSTETVESFLSVMEANDIYIKNKSPESAKALEFCLESKLFWLKTEEMERLIQNPNWPKKQNGRKP